MCHHLTDFVALSSNPNTTFVNKVIATLPKYTTFPPHQFFTKVAISPPSPSRPARSRSQKVS